MIIPLRVEIEGNNCAFSGVTLNIKIPVKTEAHFFYDVQTDAVTVAVSTSNIGFRDGLKVA